MTADDSLHEPSHAPSPHEADWFEQSFGEEYLRIYQHRDEREGERAIELIADHVRYRNIRAVLDLACGAGRHSKALCERWWTVGLDLSASLLKVARAESPEAPYVRADMRDLPFGPGCFDLVVNLFTSFGYFEDHGEHARVLDCVHTCMRPGGTFVLDYFNSQRVEAELVPYDERVENGITIEQRRAITPDKRFVEKIVTLREKSREYIERVRLFSPVDLSRMLEAAGFEISRLAGDYSGCGWSADAPRTILFAIRR